MVRGREDNGIDLGIFRDQVSRDGLECRKDGFLRCVLGFHNVAKLFLVSGDQEKVDDILDSQVYWSIN